MAGMHQPLSPQQVPHAELWLRQYLAAYEAKDLDRIASMLSDEVHLQDWNLEVKGKEAVLRETKINFDAARSLTIEVQRVLVSGLQAAAQIRIVVNKEVKLDVVDVVSFNAAGLITAVRAYKG